MSRHNYAFSNVAVYGDGARHFGPTEKTWADDVASVQTVNERRRRVTSPDALNEDLFLNLATTDAGSSSTGTETTVRRQRRKSLTATGSEIGKSHNLHTNLDIPKAQSSPLAPSNDVLDRTYTSKPMRSSRLAFSSHFPSNEATINRRAEDASPDQYGHFAAQERPVEARTLNERQRQRRSSLRNEIDINRYHDQLSNPRITSSRITEAALERHQASSGPRRRSKFDSGDGGDSVVSGTVASTVWDELDNMKSRIKQLERSGARSKYQGETFASSSADRPTTGTTFTSYNSHSNARSCSAMQDGSLHPNLQAALVKVQPVVSVEVFQTLDASAVEALQLAKISREADVPDYFTSAGSTADGISSLERRVRRKADNLCRNLTELCLALCESDGSATSPPDQSRGFALPSSREMDSRHQDFTNGDTAHASHVPQQRRILLERATERLSGRLDAGSRAVDTLESRFSSPAIVDRGGAKHARPPQTSSGTQGGDDDPLVQDSVRAAASHITSQYVAPTETSPDRDPTRRTPARAATEPRRDRPTHSPRDLRLSKDYTSKHPLPDGLINPTLQHLANGNASNLSLSSTRTAQNTAPAAHLNYRAHQPSPTKTTVSPERVRDRSSIPSRLPPTTSASLAERLDAQRRQRAVSNGIAAQEKSDTSTTPRRQRAVSSGLAALDSMVTNAITTKLPRALSSQLPAPTSVKRPASSRKALGMNGG